MKLKVTIIALTFLATSSCTILPEIVLFNNAQEAVIVSIASDRLSIKPGKSRKVGNYPVKTFQIRLGVTEYSYTVKDWPMDYSYFTGWWIFVDRKIKAQFNADGNIFILAENQTAPVPAETPQPSGFPLIPDPT